MTPPATSVYRDHRQPSRAPTPRHTLPERYRSRVRAVMYGSDSNRREAPAGGACAVATALVVGQPAHIRSEWRRRSGRPRGCAWSPKTLARIYGGGRPKAIVRSRAHRREECAAERTPGLAAGVRLPQSKGDYAGVSQEHDSGHPAMGVMKPVRVSSRRFSRPVMQASWLACRSVVRYGFTPRLDGQWCCDGASQQSKSTTVVPLEMLDESLEGDD